MDNKLKILNYLGKNKKKFTMHELSGILKIPYESFHRTIKSMPDLIIKEKAGKATLIEIKTSNPITKSYLTISSEEERKEFLKANPIINKIAKEIQAKDTILVFGSYAKRQHTEKSDIDLMIVSKDGSKTISFSKYETLFKKKINPMFVTEHEFKQMLKEKEENVGKQALQNHIILNNPERFWELVLNGI